MQKLVLLLVVLFSGEGVIRAQDVLSFRSLDDVLAYADSHSSTVKNATQQDILAKYQTLAAQLGKWNVQGRATLTLTDNTRLTTNFIPAEIFGGPAGTFQKVTFGQQYVSNLIVSPQIDIINPYSAAQVKLARTNEQLTATTNLLTKKNLYESLAGTYYNLLSYQWQIGVTRNSLANADTLVSILQDKQKEGIVRPQDVNTALANRLTLVNKVQQLISQQGQQISSLKILCDIDPDRSLVITGPQQPAVFDASLTATSDLLQRQTEWQKKRQEASLNANRKWYYPTVSLLGNLGWQQNTNNHFFDANKWLANNYVALRFSLPLLPDVGKIAAVQYDRINIQIAQNNWQHSVWQDTVNNRQLEQDYQTAYTSYQLMAQIERLQKDSYAKNLAIYKEGILSLTDLLVSFNAWLNSSLTTAAQVATSEYAKSRIAISNTLK
ncbi:TolC family protein [Spirosoma flavum]|uniref:TolC family protein n=1 Tax=Spirosoma flavum TaxID=2048557 RepID=A0ABW6AM48_9BACT